MTFNCCADAGSDRAVSSASDAMDSDFVIAGMHFSDAGQRMGATNDER